MDRLTEMELEILREVAGEKPPRPWGAAVGACLEALASAGLVDRQWCITPAGRAALKADPT